MAKKTFRPEDFLNQFVNGNYKNLDYLKDNIKKELGNNSQAEELINNSQKAFQDFETLFNKIRQEAYKKNLDVQVLYDPSRGSDQEVVIQYLPNQQIYDYELTKELSKILPKFSFSLDDSGLGTKNGLRAINQKTLINANGKYGLVTKNEYGLQQQLRLLENEANNFNRKWQRLNSAQKTDNGKIKLDAGTLRSMKNSVSYVDKEARNRVAAVSNFKDLTEESRKALQGTGSALSTAIRKNYYDIYPAIHSLVAKNQVVINEYKKKRENYYKSYERAREEIEQQTMELVALLSTPSARKGNFKLADYFGTDSKYSHFKDARTIKDIEDLAKIVNNLGVYIGTSQESSLKNYLISLTKNKDLGILGGLDDPSSRKRVQVANTSARRLTSKQNKAFEAMTSKAPIITEFMKQAGIKHDSQEMRMYSGIQVTQKELNQAIKQLINDKKIRKVQAKRLLSAGAQDGGLFISDLFNNMDVASTFTSGQRRSITLKSQDIKNLLDTGVAKSENQAIARLIAKENHISQKRANSEIRLLNENIEKENGDLIVYYDKMQKAGEATKMLSQADYGRYSASFVTNKLMRQLLINRGIQEKDVDNYIKTNQLTLIKPNEDLSYRNFSGQLESYINNYLVKAQSNNLLKNNPYFKNHISSQGVLKKEFVNSLKGTGQEKLGELHTLINELNKLNVYGQGNNPLSIGKDGEILIDTTKGIFSTPLSLFDTYEYGDPGNVVKADYRLQGATKRFLSMAEVAAGLKGDSSRATGFKNLANYRQKLYDLDSKEGRNKHKFYEDALNKAILKTRDSANANWEISKNDLIMSYGITPAMQAAAQKGGFQFVPIKPGQKISGKNKVGYIDLSGEYADIDYEKGFNNEGLKGTIWDSILQSGKTNLMYLPEDGVYAKDDNTGKSFKARGIYLPELMSNFAKQYANGETLDLPTFMVSNVQRLRTAEDTLNTIRENNKNNIHRDLSGEQFALDELRRVQLEILAEAADDITTKNGSVYQSQYAKMTRSTLRKASSVSTGFEDFGDLLSNKEKSLLESNVLMNIKDIHGLFNKNKEESLADYYYFLKHNFDYVFQEMSEKEMTKIFGSKDYNFIKSLNENSNKKDLGTFKTLLTKSVTKGSTVYKAIEQAGLLDKLHGLAAQSIRFPLSEGMDEKTVELFGGYNNLIGEGAIRVGHGIARQYNADYDGDKLGLYLAFSRGELLNDKINNVSLIKAQTEAKKVSQRMAQISAYYDLHNIEEDGILSYGTIDSKSGINELLKLLEGDPAFDIGAVASRINKFYTGNLSNKYQTVTEAIDSLADPHLISEGNRKDMVGQMVIRAIFESMTQDAISSKKVTQRILQRHGAEAFGADWTKELDTLVSSLGDASLYRNKGKESDYLYDKLKNLGILGEGDKSFSGRVGASLLGKILEIYNYNYADIEKDLGGTLSQNVLDRIKGISLDSNGNITKESLKAISKEDIFSEADVKNLANAYLGKHEGIIPEAIKRKNELIHTGSALNNPIGYLGGEILTQEQFNNLSPELQKLAIKYEELETQTLSTADAVDKEAEAEARKIKIAKEEIGVVGKATTQWKKYQDIIEEVGKTDFKYTTSVRANARRMLGQTDVSSVQTQAQKDELIKELAHRVDTIKKNNPLDYKTRYNDLKNLTSGHISESIAGAIIKAQSLGLRNINTFEDLEPYLAENPVLNTDAEKKLHSFLFADGIDRLGYYGEIGAYDDRLAGLGTLLNKYKKPFKKLEKLGQFDYQDMINSGDAMTKLILANADNNFGKIIGNEQVLNGKIGDNVIHGFADILTISQGSKGKTLLNILDLKNSKSLPTGEYALQVYQYMLLLRQLRDFLIDNNVYNAEQFFSRPEWPDYARKFRDQFGEEGLSDELIKVLTGQTYIDSNGKVVTDSSKFGKTSHLDFTMGLLKAKGGEARTVMNTASESVLYKIITGKASEEELESFEKAIADNKVFTTAIGEGKQFVYGKKSTRKENEAKREKIRGVIAKYISDSLELRRKINSKDADIARTANISDPNLRDEKKVKLEAEKEGLNKELQVIYSKLKGFASTDRKLFGGTNEWKNGGPLKELFSGEINDSAIDRFINNIQNNSHKDSYQFGNQDEFKASEQALVYARRYEAELANKNKRDDLNTYIDAFKSKGELEYLLQNSATLSPIEQQEIKTQLAYLNSQISLYTQEKINETAEAIGVEAKNVKIEDLTASGANAAKIKEYQRRKKSTKDISSYYKNLGAADVEEAILNAQYQSGKISEEEYSKRKLDLDMQKLALSDEHNAWLDVNNSAFNKEEEERLKKNYLDNKDANIASGLSKYNRSELAQERAVQREIRGIYDRLLSTDKDIYGLENQLKREPNQNKKELIQEKLGLLKEQRGDILGEINNKKGLYGSAYEGYFDSTKASYDKKLQMAQIDYDLKQKTERSRGTPTGALVGWMERMLKGGLMMRFAMQFRRMFNSVINQTKELDKAMTNLRIVTGSSEQEARNMMSSYSKLGQELGATTIEITNSANEWLNNLGHNINPSNCWEVLKFVKLQHKNEISLNVKVKNLQNWIISSEVPNRETFNDYYVETSVSKRRAINILLF